MLARKHTESVIGDVKVKRQDKTKENEALITALPEVNPCERVCSLYSMRLQLE